MAAYLAALIDSKVKVEWKTGKLTSSLVRVTVEHLSLLLSVNSLRAMAITADDSG